MTPKNTSSTAVSGVATAVAPAASGLRDEAPESPVSGALRNLVLALFLLYCLLPAMWIIAAMTKDNGQLFSTFGLWFASPLHIFENIAGLLTYQDGIFLRWFGNSLIYAGSITLGSTIICAMGGYAFSKYDFPAKQFLFNFILGTIMVPSTALVLPLFLMLNKIGLVNTMWGVILPSLVNPFGLYLMKTFWDSGFPTELIEASRLEGASEWQIFWHAADADGPGDGCPALLCGRLEQFLSAVDRLESRQPLSTDAGAQRLE
jgi:multiple sugar transport system permease protein